MDCRRSRRRGALIAGVLVLLISCTRDARGVDEPPGEDRQAAEQPAPVHASFTLTQPEIAALVDGLPASNRDAILAEPHRFLDLVDAALAAPADRTVLVDKEHALSADYVPDNLVALDPLSDRLVLSREGHRLTAATTEALLEMSDAAAMDGITLVVSSTYRSYERQDELYAYWVSQLGREEADRVSAQPGTSQHQLGTTVDFGCICPEFADQAAGIWLARNAGRFGFSLSYPDGYEWLTGYAYEPWHFRYVGDAAARLEAEFFDGLQQRSLEWLHEHRAALEGARP